MEEVRGQQLVLRQNLGQATPLSAVWKLARKNPVGFVAGVVCGALVVLAALGPALAPHDPALAAFPRLSPPSAAYPFGTDNLFRDMFSRVMAGARNSLGIGLSAVALGTCVGTVLGVAGGYFGGRWDMLTGRVVEALLAFPPLVFLIFLLSVLQPSYLTVAVAIGLVLTPGTARIVRGTTIAVRNRQYTEAATSVGAGPLRIIVRHVFPNITASMIVVASIQVGVAILAEAAISFIGLGVSSPENPSWGSMLQETRVVWQSAWWTAVIPGLAISVAVLAFNLFGDALRDILDPRLRGAR